jgi:hypothetical protein
MDLLAGYRMFVKLLLLLPPLLLLTVVCLHQSSFLH